MPNTLWPVRMRGAGRNTCDAEEELWWAQRELFRRTTAELEPVNGHESDTMPEM